MTNGIELTDKATRLAEIVVEAMGADCEGISKRQFGAAIKSARSFAKERNLFSTNSRGPKGQDPGCEMGDVVTVEIARGPRKGEMVTGRYVSWSEKTGLTKVLETTNGQKIAIGRYVQTER